MGNSQSNPANATPVYVTSGKGPTKSLDAVGATGDGTTVTFFSPQSAIAMQVSWTSNPSAVVATLLGSLDGTNFITLATFDTGAGDTNGGIKFSTGKPVIAVKAHLTTLTGGTTPKVTATIGATPN